ncbi:uncharacterized protein LOC131063223 isoform X1 [Cryptomeria japonica]|uniref:uncharacterized protein LOC131063223 isoform X1 n=1 Tax=Cryptomeria japonica TaxID=3369 RepID=UPI0027DA5D78|nr:uncharacterized protein LOC131063223 isoform X1 [Cryptomeria japonica]XP_057853003.2 uncharacterized protein LOC131063223 isoform X1 [Cryptomeria japonica]XP_059078149.1 uncharacterized protein LOC131063223 isoform X1 [Cryptomeria japonica]
MIVPATNVEVMKLEHFLEDQDKYIAKNAGGCSSLTDQTKFSAMEDLPSSDSDHEEEDVTGTSDSEEPEVERRKLNAKLEFLDVMLQRIREEERLRRASGPPGNTSSYLMREHQWNQFDGDYYKNLPNPVSNIPPSDACLEEDTPLLDSTEVKKRIFADRKIDVSWTRIENNSAKDAGGSAPSLTEVVSKPDLDGAEDRILLDKLSIRELQDTFKATFGRETSVKDKQWLKRRISIALKNSNKKNGQEYMTSRHGKSPSEKFPTDSSDVQATKSKMIIDNTDIGVPISPIGNKSSTTSFTDVFIKREFGMSNGDVPLREEIRRKRTRKPTRRYIEELSKTDARPNSGRLLNSLRDSDQAMKSCAKPDWNGFDRMTLVCREDSLGGCGIQIPFVLRVRRGRPRKNCGALVKQKTSESPTSFLKKAHVQEEQCSSDNGDMKQIVPFGSTQNFVYDDKENNEQMLISVPTDGKCVAEPFNSDSVDDVSDNYVSTIRTAKGGIRRKHHRSWTLQEVMKLVDGVSRFGVGRWSDIRKLVFSSSGYRTSVDLKDKWRNLLRASNAQLQTKKEAGNRKKHSSSPIPAPILARVRELSAMQSQALCLPSSSNPVIRSGRILHKRNPIQIKVECT